MGLKNRIKQNTTKLFDYPSLKGRELKAAVKNKIREKAILRTKARLAEHHKTFDDYTDEELEIIIVDEENKIKDDLKTKSLIGALAILGLDFFI
ncbi:hypothetical protein [Arcobacter arenosus]|jgi:Cdc6-like AAA superfamily ATPase|uniref:Uncharacterized protein n=1 Tax=Arcobacter arenosus TaxID=2576037 RepID=A0A5R8Y4S3_9BACT|nr:hypothetical protein [Arcobacter arenosus]TLP40841.1 hypothetical protein FDK22_02155 [Arcobacter arenosus]